MQSLKDGKIEGKRLGEQEELDASLSREDLIWEGGEGKKGKRVGGSWPFYDSSTL